MGRICLSYAILILGFGINNSVAQSTGEAFDLLKNYVANRQTALLQIKSFEMDGDLKITLSDDYLKHSSGKKISNLTFHLWAQGDQLRETVKYLDSSGQPYRTLDFYLTPSQVIEVDDSNGLVGKIFPLGKDPTYGLFNFCPSFLEYSFLETSITRSGIPALLPSDLVSKEKWGSVMNALGGVKIASDGGVNFKISGPSGSASVSLIKSPDSTGDLDIGSVSFFDKANVLQRKIEVLNVLHDKTIGDLGKSFRVGVYLSGPNNPSVTWQFTVKTIKLNCAVDDQTFIFDPASVDEIFDGKSKVFINVPK